MKWVMLAAVALALIVAVAALIGAMLPVKHHASRKARYGVAPDVLYAAIAGPPDWRPGVKRFGSLPEKDGRKQWWEEDARGQRLTFELLEAKPARRLVTRLADPTLPFGGTWTYEIAPAPDGGCELRITEDGEVYNVIFRFVARYFLGYTATMETCLRDLGAKFHESVRSEA